MSKLKPVAAAAAVLATLAAVSPVGAHPGSHNGLTISELATHFSSGWHLAALVVAAGATAIAISIAWLRIGARGEVRARDDAARKPWRQS